MTSDLRVARNSWLFFVFDSRSSTRSVASVPWSPTIEAMRRSSQTWRSVSSSKSRSSRRVEEAKMSERAAVCASQLHHLADLEQRVNQLTIPLSFAEELYELRSHINFVRKRIQWLQQTSEQTSLDHTRDQAPTQGNPA